MQFPQAHYFPACRSEVVRSSITHPHVSTMVNHPCDRAQPPSALQRSESQTLHDMLRHDNDAHVALRRGLASSWSSGIGPQTSTSDILGLALSTVSEIDLSRSIPKSQQSRQ